MMGGPKRKPMSKKNEELSESREVMAEGSENNGEDGFDILKGQ
jgi:hypothetical protein